MPNVRFVFCNDTAATEKERAAVDLPLAAAEKINRGDGRGRSEKGAQGSEQRRKHRRNGEVRFRDEREDGAERRSAGNAKHVRIRQGIAKQRLKAGSGYGERGTDNDAEKNARQADI